MPLMKKAIFSLEIPIMTQIGIWLLFLLKIEAYYKSEVTGLIWIVNKLIVDHLPSFF